MQNEKKRKKPKRKEKNYQFNLFNFIRKEKKQCYKIVNNRSNIKKKTKPIELNN